MFSCQLPKIAWFWNAIEFFSVANEASRISAAQHFLAFPKAVYLCVTDAKNIAAFQFFSVIEKQMSSPRSDRAGTLLGGSFHTILV